MRLRQRLSAVRIYHAYKERIVSYLGRYKARYLFRYALGTSLVVIEIP